MPRELRDTLYCSYKLTNKQTIYSLINYLLKVGSPYVDAGTAGKASGLTGAKKTPGGAATGGPSGVSGSGRGGGGCCGGGGGGNGYVAKEG